MITAVSPGTTRPMKSAASAAGRRKTAPRRSQGGRKVRTWRILSIIVGSQCRVAGASWAAPIVWR